MELLVGALVVIGVVWWIGRARRAAALREYAYEISYWEEDDDGYILRCQFPSLRGFERRVSYDYPGLDERREVFFQRHGASRWVLEYTHAAYMTELAYLRAAVAEGGFSSAIHQERLAELERSGPPKYPVRKDWVGGLEAAYQRYLSHGAAVIRG
jgi:hypothetical protein